jgi:poly(hydroxyalkanoate) depolymerase family esterase
MAARQTRSGRAVMRGSRGTAHSADPWCSAQILRTPTYSADLATYLKLFNDLLGRRHPQSSTSGKKLPTADVATIIHDALASAGLDRNTQRGGKIASVIDDALARAGLSAACDPAATTPVHQERAFTVPLQAESNVRPAGPAAGEFLSRKIAGPAETLAYKLYVPASYNAGSKATVPLLVMLHGCTQSPDDFAAGTRMNALADVHGFLVAYPAQSANANVSRCWNWFRPQDQARGSGEPALICAMIAQVAIDYRVDQARIYVAGLSAGAAMAVVLGRTYPDVFAAVGAHSGLPYGAASDMGSAFAAMRGGAAHVPEAVLQATGDVMPTIVFHGDRDHTVAAANGDAIVAQQARVAGAAARPPTSERGVVRGGHRFLRTTYADASGQVVLEDWRVHGAGHAWMGGSADGSYTDPNGPDASAEMVRFFLQHAH